MKYGIYKLQFPYGVHFGNRYLEQSNMTFYADTLFSALCIEALKSQDCFDTFFDYVKEGNLLMSDGFPFVGNELFLPKPLIRFNGNHESSSVKKKQYKNMGYVAMSKWNSYLQGELDPKEELDLEDQIGRHATVTHVSIRGEEETLPYRIGSYRFSDNAGLYIIYGYENDVIKDLFYELLDRLSFSGIGGKRASGFGRFEIYHGKLPDSFKDLLEKSSGRYVSLSIGLPKETELASCIEDASYALEKRSGFVESVTYAENNMRKRDLYMFAAGSVFSKRFSGDIFDVSSGGNHPVYKYGKPVFLGV